jgi:hypothetical protein
MPQQISLYGSGDPLSITILMMNLGIGVFFSLLLSWHFKRFGSTLSNRDELAKVFPFVLLTTTLIITVVKSSLALSLGLVGALSIVRFRTPIKEPEELAYLFIAIAMGLGLGANQTVPTIIASIGILTVTALLKWKHRKNESKNLFLSIDLKNPDDHGPDHLLERLNAVITRHGLTCDLRRVDIRQKSAEATYLLGIENSDQLSALIDDLRRSFPSVGVTFLDQNQLPSV